MEAMREWIAGPERRKRKPSSKEKVMVEREGGRKRNGPVLQRAECGEDSRRKMHHTGG